MNAVFLFRTLLAVLLVGYLCDRTLAAAAVDAMPQEEATAWNSWELWRRVVLLQDYNTRVVVCGTMLLGFSAGTVGSFTLLRRRALMGDALSHATLPGIAIAFMLATQWGYGGKSLPLLLLGGAISGVLGMLAILFVRHQTRLKEDVALGLVLSVFFGGGIALLGVIQHMTTGHAAGLESFIYGKTASMLPVDAWMIGFAGLGSAGACWLLFKELKLLCFDQDFAGSRGFPVLFLDTLLMALVVVVTIIGLQAVGLILMIALLVIPAAAARFWTHQLGKMTLIASLLGAASGMVGAALSAVLPRLPSGAMIVLVAASLFGFSLLFGKQRGVVLVWWRFRLLQSKISREHLLRAMYEQAEASGQASTDWTESSPPVSFESLLQMRSWSERRLRRELTKAELAGLVLCDLHNTCRLTPQGYRKGAKLARDHRLWELYMITHADTAPNHVDRTADTIEHVLDAEMIAKLELILEKRESLRSVPQSPHPLQ